MSSYQEEYSPSQFYKDWLPDFLTCGQCAQEFLLDNISLFIAHKRSGCDEKLRDKPLHLPGVVDLSSPLTCFACSRVFMTARGLVHHVQETHQMKICLQKGPLIISDSEVKPPPAHSFLNGKDFTKSATCFSRRREYSTSADESVDEPTDLSISRSTSLDKLVVTCCKEACGKIIQPNTNVIYSQTNMIVSALPKKRKIVFTKQEEENVTGTNALSVSSVDLTVSEDEENYDPTLDPQNLSSFTNEIGKNTAHLTQARQYENNSPMFPSADTAHNERNVRLKKLLQKHFSEAEPNERLLASSCDPRRMKAAHRAPLHLSLSQSNRCQRASPPICHRSHDDDQVISLKYQAPKFVPGSTLEQNIDHLIRTSISCESYADDFEDLDSDQSSLLSPVFKDSDYDASVANMATSPRLVANAQNSKRFTYCPSSSKTRKGSQLFDFSHSLVSDYEDSPRTPVVLAKSIPSHLNPHFLTCIKEPVNNVTDANPLDVAMAKSSPVLSPEHYQSAERKQRKLFPASERPYPMSQLAGGDEVCFNHHHRMVKTTRSSPVAAEVNLQHSDVLTRDSCIQDWLSQQDGCEDFLGAGRTPMPRSSTEQMDPIVYNSFDATNMLSEDVRLMDSGMSKKRRYPTSRPFKCAHCDQAFNQRIHLKKHMSKHTGVKPFKCQQCDYSTVERSHLKVHYRIHTGEKPYRCMYCDYATAQNSTLKIHLKRHHESHQPLEACVRKNTSQAPALAQEEEESLLLALPSTGGKRTREEHRESGSTSSSANNTSSDPLLSAPCLRQLRLDSSSSSSEMLAQTDDPCRSHKFTIARYEHPKKGENQVLNILTVLRDGVECPNVSNQTSELNNCTTLRGHQIDTAKHFKDQSSDQSSAQLRHDILSPSGTPPLQMEKI